MQLARHCSCKKASRFYHFFSCSQSRCLLRGYFVFFGLFFSLSLSPELKISFCNALSSIPQSFLIWLTPLMIIFRVLHPCIYFAHFHSFILALGSKTIIRSLFLLQKHGEREREREAKKLPRTLYITH